MAQIKTETITVVFSKLVRDDDDSSDIVTDEEYSDMTAFFDMMNEKISDGRIVEIE